MSSTTRPEFAVITITHSGQLFFYDNHTPIKSVFFICLCIDGIINIMKDRSELSKLYPSVKGRTDNVRRQQKRQSGSIDVSFGRLTIKHILAITALITLPVYILVVMINYFKVYLNQNTFKSFAPILTWSIVLWVVLALIIWLKLSKKLIDIDINRAVFLILYALVGLPVAQTAYKFNLALYPGSVEVLPFFAELVFVDLLVVSGVLLFMNSSYIPSKNKTLLMVVAFVFCVAVTIINAA